MIGQQSKQPEFEFVLIDNLVPQDHLLRKIDKTIDFSFIEEMTKDLYCARNGRPSLNPTVLFKILFIGYLFGIRSERQLMREIETNVAYRWFLNYKLTDKIPDHSTLSRNRNERFAGTSIFEDVFNEIVFQAIDWKLVNGEVLYTDSTHLKADANKRKFLKQEVEVSTRSYIEELDASVTEEREKLGKKPLKKKAEETPESKIIKVSTTDPESGYMVRDDKPRGFFYLDHRTVDGKCNVIVDAHVTPGNVHDSVPYLDRLDHVRNTFEFDVKAVGLDAGYNTTAICKGLEERDIYGVVGRRRTSSSSSLFSKKNFTFEPENNVYTCPANQKLHYQNVTRDGYREYKSDPYICQSCPHLADCTKSKNFTRVISRHIWQDHKDKVQHNGSTKEGATIYKKRKETVERSFADAKQLHGHRYARFRSLVRVQIQCFLAAACQNMKKIAQLCYEMA